MISRHLKKEKFWFRKCGIYFFLDAMTLFNEWGVVAFKILESVGGLILERLV